MTHLRAFAQHAIDAARRAQHRARLDLTDAHRTARFVTAQNVSASVEVGEQRIKTQNAAAILSHRRAAEHGSKERLARAQRRNAAARLRLQRDRSLFGVHVSQVRTAHVMAQKRRDSVFEEHHKNVQRAHKVYEEAQAFLDQSRRRQRSDEQRLKQSNEGALRESGERSQRVLRVVQKFRLFKRRGAAQLAGLSHRYDRTLARLQRAKTRLAVRRLSMMPNAARVSALQATASQLAADRRRTAGAIADFKRLMNGKQRQLEARVRQAAERLRSAQQARDEAVNTVPRNIFSVEQAENNLHDAGLALDRSGVLLQSLREWRDREAANLVADAEHARRTADRAERRAGAVAARERGKAEAVSTAAAEVDGLEVSVRTLQVAIVAARERLKKETDMWKHRLVSARQELQEGERREEGLKREEVALEQDVKTALAKVEQARRLVNRARAAAKQLNLRDAHAQAADDEAELGLQRQLARLKSDSAASRSSQLAYMAEFNHSRAEAKAAEAAEQTSNALLRQYEGEAAWIRNRTAQAVSRELRLYATLQGATQKLASDSEVIQRKLNRLQGEEQSTLASVHTARQRLENTALAEKTVQDKEVRRTASAAHAVCVSGTRTRTLAIEGTRRSPSSVSPAVIMSSCVVCTVKFYSSPRARVWHAHATPSLRLYSQAQALRALRLAERHLARATQRLQLQKSAYITAKAKLKAQRLQRRAALVRAQLQAEKQRRHFADLRRRQRQQREHMLGRWRAQWALREKVRLKARQAAERMGRLELSFYRNQQRRIRCRKPLRRPSSRAGDWSAPVFRYGADSDFSGVRSLASAATIVGDFNGDGLDDYARVGATSVSLFVSKGDGSYFMPVYPFPNKLNFGWDEEVWTTLKAVDVNGDGRADIVKASAKKLYTFLSAGSHADCFARDGGVADWCFDASAFLFPLGWSFELDWRWNAGRAVVVGDFDGDGKGDFARVGGRKVHFFISKGDGQYFAPVYHFPTPWNFTEDEDAWTTVAGDFHSNCQTSILKLSASHLHAFLNQGGKRCWRRTGRMPSTCFKISTFVFPPGWKFDNEWRFNSLSTLTGDFNGDGAADIARVGLDKVFFFINRGDGVFDTPYYDFPHSEDYFRSGRSAFGYGSSPLRV